MKPLPREVHAHAMLGMKKSGYLECGSYGNYALQILMAWRAWHGVHGMARRGVDA